MTQDMVELLDDVRVFLADAARMPLTGITAETRLREDLGVDGADADEIMAAFAHRFHVDMSGFEFSRYFGDEGMNPLADLWSRIREGRKRQITVRELAQVVQRGSWEIAV